MEREAWSSRALAAFVGVFLALGLFIALRTPFGEFPDEASHFAFVKYLRANHALPNLNLNGPMISVAFHPPLYYLVASLVVDPSGRDPVSILACRVLSLLMGAGTLILLWKTAALVFTRDRAAVLLTMAFAAFNPQFIFIHAGISNVAITSLTCALTTFLMLRIRTQTGHLVRQSWVLGASFGLALLSRTVALYLFPVAVWILADRARRESRQPSRLIVKSIVSFCFSAFLIAGWWFIRNWIKFGDPFQLQITRIMAGPGFAPDHPLSPLYVVQTAAFLHASYWAYFGKMEFHAGVIEYVIYLLIEIVALAGVIRWFAQKDADREFAPPAFDAGAFQLLVVLALLAAGEIFSYNFKIVSPQGRYLFMAILPISVALAAGILKLLEPKYRRTAARAVPLFLFLFCIHLLYFYWFRKY